MLYSLDLSLEMTDIASTCCIVCYKVDGREGFITATY